MLCRIFLPIFIGILAPLAAYALGGAGAPEIDESDVTAFVYVDGSTGDDSTGDGSYGAPYQTIRHGLLQAAALHGDGQGVKVIIMPGEYVPGDDPTATSALLLPHPQGDLPFVIEGHGWSPGTRTGDVIITGSQVWTGWVEESPGVFYSHFPYDIPPTPFEQFGAERDLVLKKDVVLRNEMIHVNGERYYRFIDAADSNMQYLEATEGAMWFDEANDRIYVKLPQTTSITDLNNERVEATVRKRLWHFWRPGSMATRTPFVVRNLVFQHAGEYGLYFQNAKGVIVEDCAFISNNQRGFSYETGSDFTFRRCLVTGNGEMGMGIGAENILAEDIQTLDNGRQSYLALFFGNGIGGAKFGHASHVTLRRWDASDNYGLGLWLDTACHNFLIEHSHMNRNTSAGVFVENNNRNNITALGNQYTAVIRESAILDNVDSLGLQTGKGVQFTENENALVEHCLIYGNQHQVSIADGPLRGPQANIQFRNNVIGSETAAQDLYHVLYGSTGWLEFFDTLNAETNDNLYYHPSTSENFRLRSQDVGGFSGWKSAHLNNPNNFSADKTVDSRSTVSTSNINGLPLLRVTPVLSSFVEDQGTVEAFTFRRITDDLTSALTVQYTVRQETGDATQGVDFSALSGSLTIPAGAATATIPVTLVSGDGVEPAEPLLIQLQGSPDYVFTVPEASFFIQDENGSLPSFGVAVETAQVLESSATGPGFRFTRSDDFSSSVSVNYSVSGTAMAGSDYQALSGTIHFSPGQSEVLLNIQPIDDTTPEFLESVTLSLTSSPDYGITVGADSATVTLLDDDRISLSSVSGNLSPGGGPVSVPLTLYNPGETAVTYTLTPPEFVYSWKDSFSSDVSYDWIEIIDNANPADNGTVVEGVASSGSDPHHHGDITWFSFTNGLYGGVLRNPQPAEVADVSRGVDWVSLGFAFNYYDTDYTEVMLHTSGFISFTELFGGYRRFGSGASAYIRPDKWHSENVTLPEDVQFPSSQDTMIAALWDRWIYDPGISEIAYKSLGGDSFVVTYHNMRHHSVSDTGTTDRSTFQVILHANGTIQLQYKDVFTPTLSILGSTVGISNTTRDKGLTIAHNNSFIRDAMGIEITPPANWLGTSATEVVVPANSSVDVDVLLDATSIQQTSSYSSQVVISTGAPGEPEVIVPVSLDVAPQAGTFTFDASAYQVNEGEGTATLTINRTGGSDGAVSVAVQSTGGTAISGTDYTEVNQVLNWSDGETSPKNVTVTITEDAAGEFDETVLLGLSAATGGASIGSTSTTTLTILDNDGPPPGLSSGLVANATQGVAFSYQVVATNSPIDYNATGLPDGLSIDRTTGEISGTPTESGSFVIDLSATNGNGTTTVPGALTLTVAPENYLFSFAPAAIFDNPDASSDLVLELIGDSSAAETLLLTTDTPARLSLPASVLRGAGQSTTSVTINGREDGLDAGHETVQVFAHRSGANVWAPLMGEPGQSLNNSADGFGWGGPWVVAQGDWVFENDSAFAAVEGAFGRSIRATGQSGHGARRVLQTPFDGSSVVWVAFAARDFTNQHHIMMGLDAGSPASITNSFNCHLQFGIYQHQVTYRINHGAFNTAGPVLADTTAHIVARIDQTAGTLYLWLDPTPGNEPTLGSAIHQVSGLTFQNYSTLAIGTYWENVRIGEIRIGPSYESITEMESFSGSLEIVDSETATPRETWRMTHFDTPHNSGMAADGYSETSGGLPNLFRYAFGVTPGEAFTAADLPRGQMAPGGSAFQYQFVHDPVASDVTFTLYGSSDLPPATPIWTSGQTLSAPVNSVQEVTLGDGREQITLEIDFQGHDRQFYRLGVE